MVKIRIINHKLERLEPRLPPSGYGMVAVLAAPSPISFGFESAIERDLNRIEQAGASSGIFQFNDEDLIQYYAYTAQTHTDRLVETLHAANGPPGRKGVTGEFVYHASPGKNEFTLRMNPADNANACRLNKKI